MFFRGKQIKTNLVLLILLLLAMPLGLSLEQEGTDYNLETVVHSGGNNGSSTNYNSLVSIPSITGAATSTDYDMSLGPVYALTGYPPIVSDVVLASSSGNNFTSDNLTVTFNSADSDGDYIYNITDWRLAETSIALLNMPFNKRVTDVSLPVKDYSTNNNNFKLGAGVEANKPDWISTGKVGGAYDFTGGITSGEIMELESDVVINLSHMTIAFWAKRNSLLSADWSNNTHDYMRVLGGPSGTYYDFLDIGVDSGTGNFRTHGERDVNSEYWSTILSSVTADTSWHHFVITGENNLFKLYIDGVYQGQDDDTGLSPTSDTFTLTRIGRGFGSSSASYGCYYNGSIDEFMVFNRSLSQEQITELYNAGLAGKSLETIVSQETSVGETWSVALTPVDEFDRGTTVLSNDVVIGSGDFTIVYNNTFVNSTTAHSFNVTAGVNYSMGAKYVENVTINYDAFSCVSSSNFTSGVLFNATFNCSGTPYETTNLNITFCDFQNTCITTHISGNDYPNQAPTLGSLLTPNSSGFYTDRNESFNWTSGSDVEGDLINYTINITNDYCADPTPTPVTNISNLYYYVSSKLGTNDECLENPYYWQLQVCDAWDCSDWSSLLNFTITSYVAVSITQNQTNFNELMIGMTVDTTSNGQHYVFENVGNVNANITNVTATALWSSVGLDTQYFQIKATNSTESNSFNWAESQTSWMNISGTESLSTFISNLVYDDARDVARADFRVEVPGAEPVGDKHSTVRFWYVQS